MRNVFLFFKKYSVLLAFLFMQGVALYMLFGYNRFHQTIFAMFSSEISGEVNYKVNSIESYFSLAKQNESLRNQNAILLSQQRAGFFIPDTSIQIITDSSKADSTKIPSHFIYMPAKVISNSVFLQQNYIILYRGSSQGILPNMAVIGPDGVIGTVTSTSENMSTVMSLLHRQSKLIAVMKSGSGLGEISWDGKDPKFLVLTKIAKTVVIKKGDTVITSPYSDRFPPGIPIGIVAVVGQDKETNTYILKIKTATDFLSVQHAYVVKNMLQNEIEELKSKIIKE
jgi:rod shape-determining protein MreC